MKRSVRTPTAGSALQRSGNLLLIIVVSLMLVTGTAGQEMPVPVAVQWAILSKVLTYDRHLAKPGKEAVVGVLYQPQVRSSVRVKDELTAVIAQLEQPVPMHFSCTAIPYTSAADLHKALEAVDVLYLAPMRSLDLAAIAIQSRERGKVTVTGVPAYVELGVAVGIDLLGGKPRVLVNLEAAKGAGADFASGLLNIAKIVN